MEEESRQDDENEENCDFNDHSAINEDDEHDNDDDDNDDHDDHDDHDDNLYGSHMNDDIRLTKELQVTPEELHAVRNILKCANDLLDPHSILRRNKPHVHEIIQLNNSDVDNYGRKYLFWNSAGTITSRNDNDYSQKLEIHFHNTRGENKDFSVVNVNDFTLAAMSLEGAVFANKKFGDNDKNPNLYFHPFINHSPFPNETFKVKFCDDERALSIAMGRGWIALTTSSNTLRIMSTTGIPLRVTSLTGRPVCLCGLGTKLAVFIQVGETRSLHVDILDIFWDLCRNKVVDVARGINLPLQNSATLVWAAFSSDWFMLTILDSKGALSIMSKTSSGVLGWIWTQVLDLGDNFSTCFWPTSIQKRALNYVPLVDGYRVPQRNFNQKYPVAKQKVFSFRLLRFGTQSDKYFSADEMQEFVWDQIIMVHLDTLKVEWQHFNESSCESWSFNQLDLMIADQGFKLDKITLNKMQLSIVASKKERAVDLVCILRGHEALQIAQTMGERFGLSEVSDMAMRFLTADGDEVVVEDAVENESSVVLTTNSIEKSVGTEESFSTAAVSGNDVTATIMSPKKKTSVAINVSNSLKLFASEPKAKNKASWLDELKDLIVAKKVKT